MVQQTFPHMVAYMLLAVEECLLLASSAHTVLLLATERRVASLVHLVSLDNLVLLVKFRQQHMVEYQDSSLLRWVEDSPLSNLPQAPIPQVNLEQSLEQNRMLRRRINNLLAQRGNHHSPGSNYHQTSLACTLLLELPVVLLRVSLLRVVPLLLVASLVVLPGLFLAKYLQEVCHLRDKHLPTAFLLLVTKDSFTGSIPSYTNGAVLMSPPCMISM